MAFDLDKRSKVVNLCPWTISFRLPNSNAEVILQSSKSTTINNGELETLAENRNVMFWGTGDGNHARVYVENPEFRQYVGFDDPDNKQYQFVLTKDVCDKIIELKTDSAFEKNIKEKVILAHEKSIFMAHCRRAKLNDYGRIKFLEEYTGEKF